MREKDVQEIDVHDEIKNTVVIAMDGEYAGNAGAISCHLIGVERIFILSGTSRSCVDFLYSTDFFRFKFT